MTKSSFFPSDLGLVVFDLDGTLIDSRVDIAASVNHALMQLGLHSLTTEEVASFIGKGIKNLLMESLGEHTKKHFKRALKIFREHYLNHCLDRTNLYPRVKEVLHEIPVRKKAVVTNKPQLFTESIMKGLGIDQFFDCVLSGDRVPNKKPAPDPLLLLMDFFNIPSPQVMMIGDSPLDIEMGKAAGAWTCAVSYGYGHVEALESFGADFSVSSFAQIAERFAE